MGPNAWMRHATNGGSIRAIPLSLMPVIPYAGIETHSLIWDVKIDASRDKQPRATLRRAPMIFSYSWIPIIKISCLYLLYLQQRFGRIRGMHYETRRHRGAKATVSLPSGNSTTQWALQPTNSSPECMHSRSQQSSLTGQSWRRKAPSNASHHPDTLLTAHIVRI